MGWFFTHESNHRIVFLPMNFEDFTLFRMSTFFRPPFSCLLKGVLRFILGFQLFHKKEVWIISKTLNTWVGTGAIRAWKTIFEIAKLLKTTICPSRVRFRYCQRFNTLCTLEAILRKLYSSFNLLLYEKQVPKILIPSLQRSMHLIPQTVTWTDCLLGLQFLWFRILPD